MSWLSIPLPNPFKSLHFDDDNDGDGDGDGDDDDHQQQLGDNRSDAGGGVKDDLSAITQSISRQFRGVAAFLAPPPPTESGVESSSSAVAGIRNDLAEIGGTFKNTLSLFSNPNKAVSEITKFASDFLQLDEEDSRNVDENDDDDYEDDDDDDEEDEYGAGVTDQVIEFARQISDRPELWFDFPLSLDDHDFEMSDAQSEHAAIVEQLVPHLADVKSKISSEKSEQQFWMIYFILLLPRLNDDDLELLSTPQIIEARETLLKMLRMKKNEEIEPDNKVNDAEQENSHSVEDTTTIENSKDSPNVENNESDITKKLAGAEDTVTSTQSSSSEVAKAHKNAADYLREEPAPSGTSTTASKTFQTEDDVSFSDLEDDDSDHLNRVPSSGSSQIKRNSSTEGSTGWVRLNDGSTKESHVRSQSSNRDRDSEGDESTDWLTVDDF